MSYTNQQELIRLIKDPLRTEDIHLEEPLTPAVEQAIIQRGIAELNLGARLITPDLTVCLQWFGPYDQWFVSVRHTISTNVEHVAEHSCATLDELHIKLVPREGHTSYLTRYPIQRFTRIETDKWWLTSTFTELKIGATL